MIKKICFKCHGRRHNLSQKHLKEKIAEMGITAFLQTIPFNEYRCRMCDGEGYIYYQKRGGE